MKGGGLMNPSISRRAKSIAWLFMLVYFTSYITRIPFTVMMVKICSDMNLEKAALAIVVTGLTVTYGVGQIISGFMGDRVSPVRMVTMGLLIAVGCNTVMSFLHSVLWMTVVWCINGFAQALFWPPMIRLMSMHLSDTEYGYAVVRTCWGSSIATILLYLVSPLLLTFMSWRIVMLSCSLFALAVSFLWCYTSPKLFGGSASLIGAKTKVEKDGVKTTVPLPRFVCVPIVLIILSLTMHGILRDGVTNWMPFYMQENFSIPEEKAILSTVVLALFSMASFSIFDFLYQKFFRNEVFFSSVIFVVSMVSAGALYVANRFDAPSFVPMLLMGVIVACMHGVNLMLITVVPKRFLKSGKVSAYSGMLNAFTYIGSSISSYGFAVLADAFGWGVTILTWIGISAIGVVACFVASPIWMRFRREYAD